MLGQISIPDGESSLSLQVEAEQAVFSQHAASRRTFRLLWAAFGFVVVMLIGVATCALHPLAAHASTKVYVLAGYFFSSIPGVRPAGHAESGHSDPTASLPPIASGPHPAFLSTVKQPLEWQRAGLEAAFNTAADTSVVQSKTHINRPSHVQKFMSISSQGVWYSTSLKTVLKATRMRPALMVAAEDAENLARIEAKLDDLESKALGKERAQRELDAAAMVEALFAADPQNKMDMEKDTTISSHLKLGRDTPLLRFVHVDEQDCIGCTYCASTARSTFYMEEEAGRARVFAQGVDTPELVAEAIDCCPVNCISYVDLEDLIILESERDGLYEGQEGQTINMRSLGYGGDAYANRKAPTKAKGQSMMNCNNCPSRGCEQCPMYGVGLNPVYIARLQERKAAKEQSGEAAKERFDAKTKQSVNDLFQDAASRESEAEVKPVMEDELDSCYIDLESDDCLEAMNSIFADDYAMPEMSDVGDGPDLTWPASDLDEGPELGQSPDLGDDGPDITE